MPDISSRMRSFCSKHHGPLVRTFSLSFQWKNCTTKRCTPITLMTIICFNPHDYIMVCLNALILKGLSVNNRPATMSETLSLVSFNFVSQRSITSKSSSSNFTLNHRITRSSAIMAEDLPRKEGESACSRRENTHVFQGRGNFFISFVSF